MLLLISLLSVVAVEDDGLYIKVKPINDEISIYEEASFNISIVNFNSYDDDINIYSPNIDAWSVKINPDSFEINPESKKNILLRLKPKSSIVPGAEYGIQLNVKGSESHTFEKIFAYVSVKSQDQINREYLPVISVEEKELGKLDITEPILYSFDIENKNVRDINNLEIMFQSDIFQKSVVVDLGPLEKKTIQVSFDVPLSTKPQKDNLVIALQVFNQTILSRSVNYEILAVEKQGLEQSSIKSLMKKEIVADLSNEGNVMLEAVYRVPTNILNYLFIHGNLDSRLISDNGFFKEYYIQLAPEESYNLKIDVSYRPILYLILVILILTVLYYLFRTPLTIHKSVVSITTVEDSLSELKVLLHIKNRSRRTFDNIIILDKIPKITEMGKEFSLGTLRPEKIMNHERKGTIARWSLKSLDSYEERVITYNLYSNLTIVGGLTLPMSILKFKRLGMREKKVVSNKVKLLIQKFKGEKKE